MVNQQLVDYIKRCLNLGFNQKQVEAELLKAGWMSDDINDGFKSLNTSVSKVQVNSTFQNQPLSQTVSTNKTNIVNSAGSVSSSSPASVPSSLNSIKKVELVNQVNVNPPSEPKKENKDLSANQLQTNQANKQIEGVKEVAAVKEMVKEEPKTGSILSKVESNESKVEQNVLKTGQKEKLGVSSISDTKITSKIEIVASQKSWRLPAIKLNKVSIAIIAVLVLIFLGGGVLAYFYYFPSPEKVLSKMMDNLSSIQILAYESETKIEFKLDESLADNPFVSQILNNNASTGSPELSSSTVNVTSDKSHYLIVNSNGQTDFKSALKSSVLLKFKTDLLANGANLGFEGRKIDNLVYVNLDLPNLGFIDLSALKGQWIKFDLTSSLSSSSVLVDPVATSSLNAKTSRVFSEQDFFQRLITKSDELKNISISSQVFKLSEVLPNEKINNLDAYHYSFVVDKTGLEEFIVKITKLLSNKDTNNEDKIKMKEGIANLGLIKGEIWIGKNDFLPYKISFQLTMKNQGKVSDLVKLENINFALSVKDFNKVLKVQAPESSKDIQAVMSNFLTEYMKAMANSNSSSSDLMSTNTILGEQLATSTNLASSSNLINNLASSSTSSLGVLGGVKSTNTDNGLDSDHDGLTDYQEINIYHTDPFNKDTDGDGYLDGEEVKNGYNPNGPGKLK